MNKFSQALSALLLSAAAIAASADGEVELVENMGKLQYFAHKAALSIDHENKQLLDFYTHELEEYIEEATTVETYHGQPIGKLINSMLIPSFEKFEAATKKDNWNAISARFDDLINTCNACHQAAQHGYISVKRSKDNPFMQSFAPSQEPQKDHAHH